MRSPLNQNFVLNTFALKEAFFGGINIQSEITTTTTIMIIVKEDN